MLLSRSALLNFTSPLSLSFLCSCMPHLVLCSPTESAALTAGHQTASNITCLWLCAMRLTLASGLMCWSCCHKPCSRSTRLILLCFSGRIFEFVHGPGVQPPVITAQNLQPIKEVLLRCINDEPHIAEKVCYAIGQLSAGFKDSGVTSPLSPYFQDLITALLGTVRTCSCSM